MTAAVPLRVALATLAMALAAATTSSCGIGGPDRTLTVLAGSELADIGPILDDLESETGIRLELELTGTLDGAERLIGGEDYDLAWFSHARYLNLLAEGTGLIAAQEPIMLSPVALGVKSQTAERLGWIDNPAVTWVDIAEAAAAGDLRFAMANPASSNSGFTGLMGVTAALAGTSDAFGEEDIDAEGLARFFTGQTLTAGSSGWLADAYVQSEESLDGMINYESVLLSLNEQDRLADELVLVYPSEGIITADYPLLLLDEEQRDAYDTVIEYLQRAEVQERIMSDTLRRPAIPGVELDERIPDSMLVELPFPRSQAVVDAVLFAYLDEIRAPSTTIYVLDVSGSMGGQPLDDLKRALLNLTGIDDSLTGRFARFRSRERVVLIPFESRVVDVAEFQRSAAYGHRPTWKLGQNASGTETKRESGRDGVRGASKDFNAWRARQAAAEKRKPRRRLKPMEKKSFIALELKESATKDDIKSQYKALVKRHHPDANGGDRGSEEKLREIIQAYNYLKQVGLV